jgi:gas vesicle protein
MVNETEFKCLCLGLGLGVAAGFLFAPKKGLDTRRHLQGKLQDTTSYVKNQASNVAQKAADVVERGGASIRQQKENVVAAVEAGKAAYREATATSPSI